MSARTDLGDRVDGRRDGGVTTVRTDLVGDAPPPDAVLTLRRHECRSGRGREPAIACKDRPCERFMRVGEMPARTSLVDSVAVD